MQPTVHCFSLAYWLCPSICWPAMLIGSIHRSVGLQCLNNESEINCTTHVFMLWGYIINVLSYPNEYFIDMWLFQVFLKINPWLAVKKLIQCLLHAIDILALLLKSWHGRQLSDNFEMKVDPKRENSPCLMFAYDWWEISFWRSEKLTAFYLGEYKFGGLATAAGPLIHGLCRV